MSKNLKMGNKHNCKNIEKPKIQKNEDEDDSDQIYNEFIKNLKLDSTKIENNLKKCNKNNELIILIESGALAPPHRMHVGILELVKKYFELNNVVILVLESNSRKGFVLALFNIIKSLDNKVTYLFPIDKYVFKLL